MTENVQAKLEKIAGLADKVSDKFGETQDKINRFRERMDEAASRVPYLGQALELLRNPITMIIAGAAALGTIGVAGVKMAGRFEENMARVNATAQLTKQELAGLRTELMEIGKDSGGNFEKIPIAFEKILSQTNDVALSMEVLKASVAGAKGGMTDLDIVAGAVGQSLSSIGKNNATAQEVMDTFFAAKRVGAGEFKDFATYLPTLIASGKTLGIQYKDVAGMFAFMTGKGQDAANASMLMQNAFTALGKGDVTRGLAGIGVNVFDKKGAMRDIGDIISDLSKRMAGLSDAQRSGLLEQAGLRDAQAKSAFSIMMQDSEKLRSSLGETNNAIGETAAAIANTNNPARTWASIMDRAQYILTKIGYVILPAVNAVMGFFVSGLDWIIANKDAILGFMIGFGVTLFTMAGGFNLVSGALWLTTKAVIANTVAWLANPMVWIPLAIAGVVTALVVMWNKFEGFRIFLKSLWETFKEVFSTLWDYAKLKLGAIGKMVYGIITFDKGMIKASFSDWAAGRRWREMCGIPL